MIRRKIVLLSSYIDGECRNPEMVKRMIEQDEEMKKLYNSLLESSNVNNLDYLHCPLNYASITYKRKPILGPVLVTAGVILLAFFMFFHTIKHSVRKLNEISTFYSEVVK